jgi:type II secretory ATPase GspE/PulE/Tfp pilus assembly ATPase PilB-like protein
MRRWLFVFAGAAVLLAVDAPSLLAADGQSIWPSLGVPFFRGSGAYLSPWKLVISWSVFLLWVRSTDWVSQDSQTLKLPWATWNAIVFFSFFATLLLFWILPWFPLGLGLLVVAYVAPLATYVVQRNKQMKSPYDKVFSPKHTQRWMARKLSKIGIKVEGADDEFRERGPDLQVTAMGAASDRDNSINLLTARQSEAFVPARELLDDAMSQRATHVMLDFSAESVSVKHQIDGVWHERPAMERADADPILEVFKGVAALKINDRRSRQSGKFGIQIGKDKYTCKVTTAGTQGGERALLQIEAVKLLFKTREELGMRAKMGEQLEELLQQPGLIVFASLPGGGLTTTLDVVLSTTDRFVRSFVAVCDVDKPERDIENVATTTFSSAEGETPVTVLPKLIRTYPDAVVIRDVADLETLAILCEQPGEKRTAITTTRAKEATEALLRLMTLKIPPADLAGAATAVVNVRLIRKLCEKCKEGYAPPAEVLKQLGLPAGRVEALYRPPTEPIDPKHPEVVCDVCQGIGYYGRTGIFELLLVTDEIREALTTKPKLDNLRAVARKAKHRSIQEEGVLLVARGVTSLPELVRVLKQ